MSATHGADVQATAVGEHARHAREGAGVCHRPPASHAGGVARAEHPPRHVHDRSHAAGSGAQPPTLLPPLYQLLSPSELTATLTDALARTPRASFGSRCKGSRRARWRRCCGGCARCALSWAWTACRWCCAGRGRRRACAYGWGRGWLGPRWTRLSSWNPPSPLRRIHFIGACPPFPHPAPVLASHCARSNSRVTLDQSLEV